MGNSDSHKQQNIPINQFQITQQAECNLMIQHLKTHFFDFSQSVRTVQINYYDW